MPTHPQRNISVLHKQNTSDQGTRTPGLAVGKTFKFPSGDAYQVQANGSVVRANPKPLSKKLRRLQRAMEEERKQLATELQKERLAINVLGTP